MNRLADTIFRGQLYYPRMLTGVKSVRMIPPDLEQYAWEKLREAVIIEASKRGCPNSQPPARCAHHAMPL